MFIKSSRVQLWFKSILDCPIIFSSSTMYCCCCWEQYHVYFFGGVECYCHVSFRK